MAGIKIVDLPSLGRDLASTDLFEMSLVGGTGSRKITGQEIMNASKLSVGNTPIVNGAVGQLLFQGAGNVLGESANLFWDNTNGRLGIGTSSPAFRLEVQGGDVRFANGLTIGTAGSAGWQFSSNTVTLIQNGFLGVDIANGRTFGITNTAFSTFYFRIAETTGNVLINTTTDAGYKLDVNGTAIVRSFLHSNGDIYAQRATNMLGLTNWSVNGNKPTLYAQTDIYISPNIGNAFVFTTTGNLLINTTTDNGFKLDVNGTARVQGALTNNSTTSGIIIRDWTAFNTYRAFYKASETPSNTNYLIALDQDVILNSRASGTDICFNGGIRARFGNAFSLRVIGTGTTTATVGFEATNSSSTPLLQVRDNGAVLIGTTTDAGFKLDVNGTARVQGALTVTGTQILFNGAFYNTVNDRNHFGGAVSISTFLRIGTNANTVASAILQADSTTQGFLPPRMTQAQRNAIASPAIGLEIYQTDATEGKYIYKSSGWTYIG